MIAPQFGAPTTNRSDPRRDRLPAQLEPPVKFAHRDGPGVVSRLRPRDLHSRAPLLPDGGDDGVLGQLAHAVDLGLRVARAGKEDT